MDHLYFVVALLSLSAVGTAGFTLWRAPISTDKYGNKCRLSRNYLALAYFLIVITHLAELFFGICSDITGIRFALILIITSIQAFLFYGALMALISSSPVSRREFWGQMGAITFFSVLICLSRFIFPLLFFEIFSAICLGAYAIQLIYYSYRLVHEDKYFHNKLNNYFAGDEPSHINWIRRSYWGVLCIGFTSFLVLLCSPYLYLIYTCLYTLFYIYFAAKILNYFTVYSQYGLAVSEEETEAANPVLCGAEAFIPALEKWILAKGFVRPDITLRTLAAELNTNQTYLSNYINAATGQNFRNWISRLRIEEAELLLDTHPDYAVSYVGELVGILNKSSFFRQFANVTGMTPNEFRKKNCRNQQSVLKRGKKRAVSETNYDRANTGENIVESDALQSKE